MSALKVPTIFTAIDKFSSPVKGMSASLDSFVSKAETGLARSERAFRKLTPSLSSVTKEFFAFASAAAITAGIISGIHFSVQGLKDYETAVASFRTIVSDLDDEAFKPYQKAINQVAVDTRKSSIDVANSFEKIAGLNSAFAETSEGLSAVSKASITLAKASRMELGASAESLVGIMNQFSLEALEADRAINVLAAGQAVGAANIQQTGEAFVNFGAVAKGANITLEESVALIQTLGKFSLFGAEAGTKLRGATLKLQKAGIGYASGQFNINDALEEAKKKVDKLTTAKKKDAFLTDIFGAENITAGRILIDNISTYEKFTTAVTGTTEAQKAADINSKTLTVAIDELGNAWINMLTSSNSATSGLNTAKSVINLVTNNLDTIVSVGSKVLLFFAAWKASLIVGNIVMGAYNIALGIQGALTGVASIAIGKSAIALKAYNAVTYIATAAQWLWNAAMTANPIGLVIVAIIALIGFVVLVIKKWNEWGAAMSLLILPVGIIIGLIQSFRRNWDMITQAFKEGGILAGLKAIGATILDAILMPLQQLLEIAAKLTGFDWAADAAKSIEKFRADMGVNVTTDESGKPIEAINPKKSEQDALVERMESTQNQNVKIDINDKTGRAKMMTDTNLIPINLTSTLAY